MRGLIVGAAMVFGLIGVTALEAQGPGEEQEAEARRVEVPLSNRHCSNAWSRRIPAATATSNSVHQGSGPMAFGTVLGGGAVPGLGFIHRGRIPPGGGIGVHFHLSTEEMFVILNDAEAQFTINGRTSLIKTPVGVPVQLGTPTLS
jgi:hypothetical protein